MSSMNNIIENKSCEQQDNNYTFLRNFIMNMDSEILGEGKYLLSYSQYPAIHNKYYLEEKLSQKNSKSFIHFRKESYENNPSHYNYNLYKKLLGDIDCDELIIIDCIDGHYEHIDYSKRFYIPWATISLFSRSIDFSILRTPLKNIYTPELKTKFCDYLYKNRGNNLQATDEDLITKIKNKISRSLESRLEFFFVRLKKLINKILRSLESNFGIFIRPRNNYEKLAEFRYLFYTTLNNKKSVDIPIGSHRNNESLFDEAVSLHMPYKFNIAFENSITPGWITEKIVNAFLAGCIPIYSGDNYVFKFFNKKAFIYAQDFKTMDDLVGYVLEVDSNSELYEKYISEAPCTEENFKNLMQYCDYNLQ